MDKSGEILELENAGCPWKQHLYDLEEQLDMKTLIKFVIYPDNSGKWRVQVID